MLHKLLLRLKCFEELPEQKYCGFVRALPLTFSKSRLSAKPPPRRKSFF